MSWIKKWSINLLLLIISILATTVVIEVALRFTDYRFLLDPPLRDYHKADAVLGFDIAENSPSIYTNIQNVPYKIWSNEIGCFDRQYNGENEYILLIGDSFTWGYAPFEDKWGTQLEKNLDTRVLKCGVMAYGTKQELIKARNVVDKTGNPPKLIILGYCSDNDFMDDYLFPRGSVVKGYLVEKVSIEDERTGKKRTYSELELQKQVENWEKYCTLKQVSYPALYRIKCFLLRNSIISNMAKYHAMNTLIRVDIFKKILLRTLLVSQKKPRKNIVKSEEYPWKEEAWKDHMQNLKEMKVLAENSKSKLLVIYIPRKYQVYDFLKGNSDLDQKKDELTHYLEKEMIDYIDLTPVLKEYANQKPRQFLDAERDLYWRYDGHWNIKGNHLVGLILAKHILEQNLIYIPDKEQKLKLIEKRLSEFK